MANVFLDAIRKVFPEDRFFLRHKRSTLEPKQPPKGGEELGINGVGKCVRNVDEPGRAATEENPQQGGIFRELCNGVNLLESPTL